MDSVLLQSGFATLALEALKWFIYNPVTWLLRLLLRNPGLTLDIPVQVYLILLPVLNFLAVPALAFAGFTGFALPTDLTEFGREILRLVIQSLISVLLYNGGLKPTKDAVAKE